MFNKTMDSVICSCKLSLIKFAAGDCHDYVDSLHPRSKPLRSVERRWQPASTPTSPSFNKLIHCTQPLARSASTCHHPFNSNNSYAFNLRASISAPSWTVVFQPAVTSSGNRVDRSITTACCDGHLRQYTQHITTSSERPSSRLTIWYQYSRPTNTVHC